MVDQVPDHSARSDAAIQERSEANEGEVARLRRGLAQALEQQAATAEVLRVIASSPADVQSALEAIFETARRLCAADGGNIQRVRARDGRLVPCAGSFLRRDTIDHDVAEGWYRARGQVLGEDDSFDTRPGVEITLQSTGGRAFLERRPVIVTDMAEAVQTEFPAARDNQAYWGFRSLVAVPLLQRGEPIGVLHVVRLEVRPFSDHEVALLASFADQAVIAFENARLFEELEQRNADLTEALEQQTATAEVLRVIASSPTDVQRVLDAVAERAYRLCRATSSSIYLVESDQLRVVAAAVSPTTAPPPPGVAGTVGYVSPIIPENMTGRTVLEGRVIHIADAHDPAVRAEYPAAATSDETARSRLHVPLRRDGIAIGLLAVRRHLHAPFSASEIALMETFADQAVIAIQNAGLFEELEQRNAQLHESNRQVTEALEQQTASAEVLRVIATSPTDLTSVFRMIVEQTGRICETNLVALHLRQGDDYVLTTVLDPNAGQLPEGSRIPLDSSRAPALVIRSGTPLVSDDLLAETDERLTVIREHAAGLGYRSSAAFPLMRDNVGIGAITIMRREVRPFTDQQIALLRTFADQAVIAIENARLFTQLQESNRSLTEALEQQTATSEILSVIASSPVELQPVFDALVTSALRLVGDPDRDMCALVLVRDGMIHPGAFAGWTPEMIAEVSRYYPGPISRAIPSGRAVLDRTIVHIPDREGITDFRTTTFNEIGQVRSQLVVPLMAESEALGTLAVARAVPGAFTEQQIALLQTFADQAVIAIENARLFEELGQRNAELAELNQTLEARVSEQVDQLERAGRLRRYLSPQLAEMIVSSGDESILASHRRQITVVFCDLRGFTAFAEMTEPEEVMAVLGEYHAAMGDLIRKYEGTFGHFAGDGLMIFFNDPLPQLDHVERAIQMACAMRERAVELARGWRRAGYELGFGVGIAVGYATLGRIGFEGRYDYDVIGTVANLAARLCAEAADRQILIPARLHGMVEDLIEVEPIGDLTLKGLHRPVAAFNITGLREDGSSSPDPATGQAAEAP